MNAALTACSNAPRKNGELSMLRACLSALGLKTEEAPNLSEPDFTPGRTPEKRAQVLMEFFSGDDLDLILDISGGDLANGILPYLDYKVIRASRACLWGYSDLTVLLNAIYAQTGNPSVLFPVRSLVWENGGLQQKRFSDSFGGSGSLFSLRPVFCQGSVLEGTLIGGNTRCLLKLAGTPYFPDTREKVLLLEALGGDGPLLSAYFAQLSQMGVFRSVSGILLGTFTQFETLHSPSAVFPLLRPYLPSGLPVAKTQEVGHGNDSRAVLIGGPVSFRS